MGKEILYTVGHSNQTFDEFLHLIESQGIDCVIDVRSMPYSKYTPQFNSEVLKTALRRHGIVYAHFGVEFGARRTDCLSMTESVGRGGKSMVGQVDFERGVMTENFLRGVERLKKALSQERHVTLMCSESDPLACHRFSFLSRYFYDQGWNVRHIVRDAENGAPCWKTHEEVEMAMVLGYVTTHKLPELPGQVQSSLFMDFGDGYDEMQQRRDAYRLKNREIGWKPTEDAMMEDSID